MRFALFIHVFCVIACGSIGSAIAGENLSSKTTIGATNPLLTDGSLALEQGRIDDGLRLTLEGLKIAVSARDLAAGHSNACAAFAMLKRWDEALEHCNAAIELDGSNWRTFNNRSAIFVAKGLYDLAIADVMSGLKLAPESSTLKKSLQIASEHKRARRDKSRSATTA